MKPNTYYSVTLIVNGKETQYFAQPQADNASYICYGFTTKTTSRIEGITKSINEALTYLNNAIAKASTTIIPLDLYTRKLESSAI